MQIVLNLIAVVDWWIILCSIFLPSDDVESRLGSEILYVYGIDLSKTAYLGFSLVGFNCFIATGKHERSKLITF